MRLCFVWRSGRVFSGRIDTDTHTHMMLIWGTSYMRLGSPQRCPKPVEGDWRWWPFSILSGRIRRIAQPLRWTLLAQSQCAQDVQTLAEWAAAQDLAFDRSVAAKWHKYVHSSRKSGTRLRGDLGLGWRKRRSRKWLPKRNGEEEWECRVTWKLMCQYWWPGHVSCLTKIFVARWMMFQTCVFQESFGFGVYGLKFAARTAERRPDFSAKSVWLTEGCWWGRLLLSMLLL